MSRPAQANATPPVLAQYRPLRDYTPQYGDFVVWSGWVTCWHGVVSNYDAQTGTLHIIFSTVPFILFTLTDDEQKAETRLIKLSRIKGDMQGTWAILQHDHKSKATIWYV